MTGTTDVKFVDFEIKEDAIELGALEIVKAIRPQWKIDDIKFKLLTDGITNKLVKCFLQDKIEDVVLVRVYGQKTDMLIDRAAETRNILLLNKERLAPALFATFKNGLAYEFAPGLTLDPDSVTLPKIYSLVARKMANLHLVRPDNYLECKPAIWLKIQQFYDLIPDTFSDAAKQKQFEKMHYMNPKSKFLEEINQLKSKLDQLQTPIVFSHNDLLLGNVIYNCDKNCVTFIDYEYAHMNYQAFDIGNHFAEFQGINDISNSNFNYPGEKLQKDWISCYLKEYLKKDCISEEEIHTLYVQVNKFALAAHIMWGLWALVQGEHSTIDFNYMEYAETRLQQYFSSKEEFLALM